MKYWIWAGVAVIMAVSSEPWLGRWRSCADLWSSLAPGLPEIIPPLSSQSTTATEPGSWQVWFIPIVLTSTSILSSLICWKQFQSTIKLLPPTNHRGHAKDHTVSHWLLTMEAQVQFQGSRCGISGRQSVTGADFSQSTSVFPTNYLFTNIPFSCHITIIKGLAQ
jgi:hypothetical protein